MSPAPGRRPLFSLSLSLSLAVGPPFVRSFVRNSVRAGRKPSHQRAGNVPTSAPMRQECEQETATSSTSERQLQLWRAASQETRDEYRRAAEGQTSRRRNEDRYARAQLMRDHKKRTAGRPQWQPPVVLAAGGCAPLGVASFRPQPAPPRGDGGAPPLPPPAPPNPNPTPNPNPNPNPNPVCRSPNPNPIPPPNTNPHPHPNPNQVRGRRRATSAWSTRNPASPSPTRRR